MSEASDRAWTTTNMDCWQLSLRRIQHGVASIFFIVLLILAPIPLQSIQILLHIPVLYPLLYPLLRKQKIVVVLISSKYW